MKKICSKCKEEKELTDFHFNKTRKSGLHHYCKSCHSIYRKNTYSYIKNRNKRILDCYKLDESSLDEMYITQNKSCKICKKEYNTVSKHGGLYIDHCHISGKVRGLLCSKCNMLLGNCNDDSSILTSAITYLINSQI